MKLSARSALLLLVPSVCYCQTLIYDEPDFDRWNYGPNATPGTRSQASTFTGLPTDTSGNDRLAQFMIGFDTGQFVPKGLPLFSYTITRVTLTATIGQDNLFAYDPSYDQAATYLNAATDTDAGRPLELHGVGFRNGFDVQSFLEGSSFAPTGGQQNAFPIIFDNLGDNVDVTENVTNQGGAPFESAPWAVGQTTTVTPGALVPIETVFRFDVDLNLPGVRTYFQQAFQDGKMRLMLSSLTPAVQQGGEFVSYFTREDSEHQLFGGLAPTLEVEISTRIPVTAQSDLANRQIVLSWPQEPGFSYELFSNSSLVSGVWTSISTTSSSVSEMRIVNDPIQPGSLFYQLEFSKLP